MLFRSREALAPGNHVEGPAVVVEDDSTVVVQPGHEARVDRYEAIEITRGETA